MSIQAEPPPEGVNLTTWLIAEVPPASLTRAVKYVVPSYEALVTDKEQGGSLMQLQVPYQEPLVE